jgi:hypothetical protein
LSFATVYVSFWMDSAWSFFSIESHMYVAAMAE